MRAPAAGGLPARGGGFGSGFRGRRRRRGVRLYQPQCFSQIGIQRLPDIRIVFQELACVFTALADALAFVAEPRAALFDHVLRGAQIQQVAFFRNTLAVNDVEFGFAERRRDLVLHYLDLGAVSDHALAIFDGRDAADVEPHRRVKLQRAAAGGGFRIAEHDADLFANLIDEDQAGPRLVDRAGQLAERLRHEPRLQTHVAIAHFAIELALGHQRRDRIDHQHVDLARRDQVRGDFQRLLTVIGLGDEQVVHVDAEFARVSRIEGVLDVDECRDAALLLRFGHCLEGDGGFARGFRPEDLADAPAGKAAHAERGIERNRAGGDHRYRHDRVFRSEPQDRALAELLFNLTEGGF